MRLDLSLLAICFTIFTFLVAVNPGQLKDNLLITLQLVLAIPLLLTSIFAKMKITNIPNAIIWERYSYISFTIAYGFLINLIGNLLCSAISLWIGIVFFIANILFALIYSVIVVKYYNHNISKRVLKDSLFILTLILLGILPALNVY